MPRSARWRLIDPDRILWERWPDECIVYNDLSGQTHLLNVSAAAALELLGAGGESAETLAEKLNVDSAEIERLLQEFDQLGLIEPDE